MKCRTKAEINAKFRVTYRKWTKNHSPRDMKEWAIIKDIMTRKY